MPMRGLSLQGLFIYFLISLLLVSCGMKPLQEGEYALVQNEVIVEEGAMAGRESPAMTGDAYAELQGKKVSDYIIQKPKGRTISFKRYQPTVLDTTLTEKSCVQLRNHACDLGWLDAQTSYDLIAKGQRVAAFYKIIPGQRYTVRNISYDIDDSNIDSLLRENGVLQGSLLRSGQPFSTVTMQEERKRITSWLNNNGYMLFNKEHITFRADSSCSEHFVDLTLQLGRYRRNASDSLHDHTRYYLRSVSYVAPTYDKLPLRAHTLSINTLLQEGDPYNADAVQRTYNKFARLRAIRSTNITFTHPSSITQNDSLPLGGAGGGSSITSHPSSIIQGGSSLDAVVQLTPRKKHSIQLQPEGTNTAGDFGAALSVVYENRNIFHGSEVFSLSGRVAFEAISGLEGYSNSNYEEYGVEGKLTFPEFIIPGISDDFQRTHNATTELSVSYNRQNRPEFHRRVFTGRWRYRWTSHKGNMGYTFDLLDLNYISMPWISSTFKHDYLDSISTRNAILRYNYEDLFIMKIGFGIKKSTEHYSIQANIETAGNLLYGLSQIFTFPTNSQGKYKAIGIAFAQYAKFDFDYTRLLRLNYHNILALHGRFGIAVPYGNSDILPFEKRYFSGGANSVRGWSVRTLGPGGYISNDGRINFLNQSGDVKLDLNAELRTDLFWKFQGAVFIDAGNIWTLRDYADQQGGQLRFKDILRQMAVAYGIGLRLNFDYFIMRLDLGMKAINPAYTTTREHYPIAHPNFKRDYALHFAVGLPF